jgi:hypothetical protein
VVFKGDRYGGQTAYLTICFAGDGREADYGPPTSMPAGMKLRDKAWHRPTPQWEDGRMWIGHGRRHRPFAQVFVVAAVALIAATLSPRSSAADYNEQTLYRFCPEGGCTDGASPYAGLIMDGAGNLYGTTFYGGTSGRGVVFQLRHHHHHHHPHQGTAWTETVLYSFCSQTECADGAHPYAGLIMDGAGSLYGTTSGGNSGFGSDRGVVFALNASLTARGQRAWQR